MDRETISDRIKRIRESEKLNQGQFAKKIGVGQSAVTKIENGGGVSAETIIEISNVFFVSIEWLLMGTGVMKKQSPGDKIELTVHQVFEMWQKSDRQKEKLIQTLTDQLDIMQEVVRRAFKK